PPGWEPDGDGNGFPAAAVLDWSRLPEAAAHRREVRQALEAALQELPPDYRMVVLLRDLEGLSTQEAAEALGLGLSAVKMRLHRGRLALRKSLESVFDSGGA
ncbi:MAG: sigma-70 family RNA polymerase sigma factor, partial [Acidobacteria bacterium]|nr:sigma-70 family RNA polymerase sigma factor [Acidobacteriota bacterium]